MTTIFRWLNSPRVLAALLLTGITVDLILIGQAYDLSKSDWGTWVGSIGTVATLIGTIYLATSESRRRNQVEMQIADLRAVELVVALDSTRHRLLGIARMLEVAANNPPQHNGLLVSIASLMQEVPAWNVEDALPFAVYRGEIARDLVHLFALLKNIKKIWEINIRTPGAVEEQARRAHDLLPGVGLSIEMLVHVETALNKHARLVLDLS